MTEQEVKLIIGSLLHDIGKVVYRQGDDRRNHSQSGYEYLKKDIQLKEESVLHCVRYHHGRPLGAAKIPEDDMAYIVYVADNIAAATDRRKKEEGEGGFDQKVPLQSVFNILNNNKQEYYYKPGMLNAEGVIPFPQERKIPFDETFYTKVKYEITENLKRLEWTNEYINSLLEVLEATLTYVPSSTNKEELADISLYDHVKMTAAIASCLYQYLNDKGTDNYKDVILGKKQKLYKEDCFLLCSMDVSGIQDFIYTIASKNALRTLRARSFYLEIMMEHIIDVLLEKLDLSRANLIYSGGGHCYMLLPNTEHVKEIVDDYLEELKQWFLKYYRTELYVAGGYAACNSNTLKNEPEGSYSNLFRSVGDAISTKKSRRYTAKDILELNYKNHLDYTRECKVCKNIGNVDDEGVCPLCRKIEKLSQYVLYSEFFTVLKTDSEKGLLLPGGYELVASDDKNIREQMSREAFVRTYAKNKMYTGKHVATKVWVGDYTKGQTFKDLAEQADGVKRIGVLRADVDNLGQTFVSGFENKENQSKYVTLSRTATLSRQLSLFFKLHINSILEHPEYTLDGKEKKERNATIIYSGGDDVFLVGAWDDVIELAIDLEKKLKQFTQNTLTISGGIGIYDAGYPVQIMAGEVGQQEDKSKKLDKKNAVTLLEDGDTHMQDDVEISDGTYKWKELEKEVIGEKYQEIATFLDTYEDKGNAFLYRLLELIRNQKDKINFARYIYLLARLEPARSEGKERMEAYQQFSRNMYQWIQSEKDCRQLRTAIQLYVYKTRGEEE